MVPQPLRDLRENCGSRMNIDPTFLFLSLIPSGIGFVLFRYGKKADRWPQLVGGLMFMLYPYFTGSTSMLVGVGTLLGAAVYATIRAGW